MKTPDYEKLIYEENRVRRARIWATAVLFIVLVICASIIILNSHPYVIRFEMDNNTLEAVKAINWTAVQP